MDKIFVKVNTQNWIILMILGSASFFLMNSEFTLGIILGGLIIMVNFNLLQHTICRDFSPDGVMITNMISIIAKYYFRLAITGLIIYILITSGTVNPIGLTIGLSTVVISIVNIGIRAAWKTSSGEAF